MTALPAIGVLLLGPTGAGKSPLGDLFEGRGLLGKRCLHFDFGRELRTIAACSGPPEGFTVSDHTFIQGVLEKGLLLENEHFPIAEKIVRSFLSRKDFSHSDILILNGLPRHAGQAQDMARLVQMLAVAVLECDAVEVEKRIVLNTGGDRAGRTDDASHMIGRKIALFRERTAPLIDYYDSIGCRIIRVPVKADTHAEEAHEDVSARAVGLFP